jgi:hypothetical protein
MFGSEGPLTVFRDAYFTYAESSSVLQLITFQESGNTPNLYVSIFYDYRFLGFLSHVVW